MDNIRCVGVEIGNIVNTCVKSVQVTSSVCVGVCVYRGGSSSICQCSGWPGVPVGNWILKFRMGDD